jgi:hypothetical protein
LVVSRTVEFAAHLFALVGGVPVGGVPDGAGSIKECSHSLVLLG